jgi:hypothetical protein
VFQVFFNFGTTQMKEVLTLIPRVLPILCQTKLTAQQLVKIAAFLQTSDVVTRIESTIVLKSMIEQGIYDKPESLKNLFPYIISNCSKDAVPDLLQPSLEIVALLLQITAIKDSFVTGNGLQAIVDLHGPEAGSRHGIGHPRLRDGRHDRPVVGEGDPHRHRGAGADLRRAEEQHTCALPRGIHRAARFQEFLQGNQHE